MPPETAPDGRCRPRARGRSGGADHMGAYSRAAKEVPSANDFACLLGALRRGTIAGATCALFLLGCGARSRLPGDGVAPAGPAGAGNGGSDAGGSTGGGGGSAVCHLSVASPASIPLLARESGSPRRCAWPLAHRPSPPRRRGRAHRSAADDRDHLVRGLAIDIDGRSPSPARRARELGQPGGGRRAVDHLPVTSRLRRPRLSRPVLELLHGCRRSGAKRQSDPVRVALVVLLSTALGDHGDGMTRSGKFNEGLLSPAAKLAAGMSRTAMRVGVGLRGHGRSAGGAGAGGRAVG